MIVEIPKVGPEGAAYDGEEPPSILDLEPGTDIRPAGALTYALQAEIVSRRLLVRGRIAMPVTLRCARCAVLFSTTLTESSFLRAYPLRDEQVEVDVTPDLREAVLLRLPSHPRCREDCAGLCPRCGADLNERPCDCAPATGSPGWGALDGLNLDRP